MHLTRFHLRKQVMGVRVLDTHRLLRQHQYNHMRHNHPHSLRRHMSTILRGLIIFKSSRFMASKDTLDSRHLLLSNMERFLLHCVTRSKIHNSTLLTHNTHRALAMAMLVLLGNSKIKITR